LIVTGKKLYLKTYEPQHSRVTWAIFSVHTEPVLIPCRPQEVVCCIYYTPQQ